MATGPFDGWRPAPDQIVAYCDWQRHCPYNPQSPALLLPGGGSQTAVLPLFGAASAAAAGTGLADGSGAEGSGGELTKAEASDVVLNVGGPVWALDWCPAGTQASGGDDAAGASAAASAQPSAPTYLAVGCHPLEAQVNVVGVPVQGPACIQVWELSHPEQQQQQQQQAPPAAQQPRERVQEQGGGGGGATGAPVLPRVALALAHDGGVTWHCRWCPSVAAADEPAAALPGGDAVPRLGLLAAALGDGSMRVWAVPHPHAPQVQAAAGAAPGQPLVLSLPPVAALASAALGGSMPSVVDWLPAAPHDLLLVGCWDGSVAVLRMAPEQPVPPAQQQQQQQQQEQQQQQQQGGPGSSGGGGAGMHGLELLAHFSADVLPLRALRWVPPAACAAAVDGLERCLFMTGGHEGVLRVWDVRDLFQPVYSHVLSSNSTILGADWALRPFGILVAMEDASLRGLPLDSDVIERGTKEENKAMFSISWRGPNMGALWSIAVQPHMQVVAYAGEDGEVGLFPAEFEGHSRRRRAHEGVSGLRLAGVALAVRSWASVRRGNGLFASKVVERMQGVKKARLPEEAEALHRVAWSAHSGGAAWLASGGAAGLVRCQWIQAH